MEWVTRDRIAEYPAVADLEELLQVMERGDLTEFQYVIENNDWKAILK